MKKEKWRDLSFREKILRIVDCGWNVVLAVIMLFILGTWVWKDMILEQPALRIEMIDAQQHCADARAFQPLLERSGYEYDQNTLAISKRIQSIPSDAESGCDPSKLLFCSLMEGRTDIYFWESEHLRPMLIGRGLRDLREILSAEVLERHQEDLVYTAPLLQGGFPCGVQLRDNAWLEDSGYYESCIVGVSDCAQNVEMIGELLNDILT